MRSARRKFRQGRSTLPRDRRGITPSAVGFTLPRDRRGMTPSAVGSRSRVTGAALPQAPIGPRSRMIGRRITLRADLDAILSRSFQ